MINLIYFFTVGCVAAAVNGGVQPVFAILFSEIIGVFADPRYTDAQRNDIVLYSLLFVAIGGASFVANIIQVDCLF